MYAPEKNQNKIIETKALLKDIIKNPDAFKSDKTLKEALNSQEGLAKYENKHRNIVACSPNTVKTHSEALLERGFVELDELRNNAKSALDETTPENKPNKTTKAGLKLEVARLERNLDITQRSNSLLIVIIDEMRSKLKQMSESNNSIESRRELYRTFNKEIEAELSYTLHGEV